MQKPFASLALLTAFHCGFVRMALLTVLPQWDAKALRKSGLVDRFPLWICAYGSVNSASTVGDAKPFASLALLTAFHCGFVRMALLTVLPHWNVKALRKSSLVDRFPLWICAYGPVNSPSTLECQSTSQV